MTRDQLFFGLVLLVGLPAFLWTLWFLIYKLWQHNDDGEWVSWDEDEMNPDSLSAGDRKLITQQHEIVYWCRQLGVTEEELRNAISKVGPAVYAVKAFFGR